MSVGSASVTTRRNLVSEQPSPGAVSLVSNDQTQEIIGMVSVDYEEMIDDLKSESTDNLRARVRSYDNLQRLTLGRAQTAKTGLADLKHTHKWDSFLRLNLGNPDKSFFPKKLQAGQYPGVLRAVQYSIEGLVNGGDFRHEEVMATVFCHRVLVRPGEQYLGFLHRDLPKANGRIGTAVWYPRVDSKRIDGAQLFAFERDTYDEVEAYRSLSPDYVFDPSVYGGAVLMMAYPRNFVHGVRSGSNHAPGSAHHDNIVTDFLEPSSDCFIKDLTIVTVSAESPVEE